MSQATPGERIIQAFVDAYDHEQTVDIAVGIASDYALRLDRLRKHVMRRRRLGTVQPEDYSELGVMDTHAADATDLMHYTDQLRGKFDSNIRRTIQRYAGSAVTVKGLYDHAGPVLYRDYTARIPVDFDITEGHFEGLHSDATYAPVVSITNANQWGWRRRSPEYSRLWARVLDDDGEPIISLQIEE